MNLADGRRRSCRSGTGTSQLGSSSSGWMATPTTSDRLHAAPPPRTPGLPVRLPHLQQFPSAHRKTWIKGHVGSVEDQLCNPEGPAGSRDWQLRPVMLLAGSYDHTCKIWDIRNKQVRPWQMSLGCQTDQKPDNSQSCQTPRGTDPRMSLWLRLHSVNAVVTSLVMSP